MGPGPCSKKSRGGPLLNLSGVVAPAVPAGAGTAFRGHESKAGNAVTDMGNKLSQTTYAHQNLFHLRTEEESSE